MTFGSRQRCEYASQEAKSPAYWCPVAHLWLPRCGRRQRGLDCFELAGRIPLGGHHLPSGPRHWNRTGRICLLALDGQPSRFRHQLEVGTWADPLDGRCFVGVGGGTRCVNLRDIRQSPSVGAESAPSPPSVDRVSALPLDHCRRDRFYCRSWPSSHWVLDTRDCLRDGDRITESNHQCRAPASSGHRV
jgi:hypothetical protein